MVYFIQCPGCHTVVRVYRNNDLAFCGSDPGVSDFCDTSVLILKNSRAEFFRNFARSVGTAIAYNDNFNIPFEPGCRVSYRMNAAGYIFFFVMSGYYY